MSVKIKAKNPSNQLQTLLCDASGRLMVDAEVQIDNVGLATSALQGAGLPSALSSDNLKVSLKETITVPVSNAGLTELASAINSDKVDVNIASGNISGFATSALQGAGLPSALSSDNLKVSLKETITVPVSNGGLTELESAINSNKVDVNISSGAITGFSTSALQATTHGKLDSVIGELESILSSSQIISEGFTACDTGAVVISSSALPSGASTSALQRGGLPSALSSDNLKVSLKETITVPVSNAGLTELASAINSDRVDVNIANGGFDGAITNGALTELASAINSDRVDVNIANGGFDGAVSNVGLTALNGAIGSNKVNVNISSGNISGFATSALQAGGLPSALSSDNLKVSLKETITVPVSNAVLTSLDNCIDSNELQVDIVASALPSGASTATLQGGGLPSALSSDNLKVSLKETITVPVSNAGLTELASAINSDRVDVNIANGGFDGAITHSALTELASALNSDKLDVNISSGNISGFSTSANQSTANGHLLALANVVNPAIATATATTIPNKLDLIETANTVKDVEWLSGATISDQQLSDVLDTEGYQNVFIYGENGGSISANSFKIFGSNASAGTYYSVGQMAVVTSDSGRYLIREDTPLADMPSPRYLKVFNNTGSTQTITKLRAVMSNKLRYV